MFCPIFPWSALSTVLPVKICQVYSFIYCPVSGKFSPITSFKFRMCVPHTYLFLCEFRLRKWNLDLICGSDRPESRRWGHSCKTCQPGLRLGQQWWKQALCHPKRVLSCCTQDMTASSEQWSPTLQAIVSTVNILGECRDKIFCAEGYGRRTEVWHDAIYSMNISD